MEDVDNALIVFDIFKSEHHTLVIFEPFLCGMVADNMKSQADSRTPSKY